MRKATVTRKKTKETNISVSLNLDGTGTSDIRTSVPFLDHMLDLMTFHGLFDLKIKQPAISKSTIIISWKTWASHSVRP